MAGLISLRPSAGASKGDQRPAATSTLRYGGVEVDVPVAWAEREISACPAHDTAYVGTLHDWTSTPCSAGHRSTALVMTRGDEATAATLPADVARRVVGERHVVVAVRTSDPGEAQRLLAGVRLLRVGDTVDGCPAAALTSPLARGSFATVTARPDVVRGATVCSYAGVWLGAVRHLDRASARSLVDSVSASAPPGSGAFCDAPVAVSAELHGWLIYLDTSPGTTALVVLQRCVGDIDAEVLITGERSLTVSSQLWRQLVDATDDHGLTQR